MSLIPEFKLGLWNAWLFMLYWIISNVLPLLLSGWLIDKEVLKKGSGAESLSETEKKNLLCCILSTLCPICLQHLLATQTGDHLVLCWIHHLFVGGDYYDCRNAEFLYYCSRQACYQRSLPFFKKPHLLWDVLDFWWNRHRMCFLDFSATYCSIHNCIAYFHSLRRTILPPEIWRRIPRIHEQNSKMDRNTEIGEKTSIVAKIFYNIRLCLCIG